MKWQKWQNLGFLTDFAFFDERKMAFVGGKIVWSLGGHIAHI